MQKSKTSIGSFQWQCSPTNPAILLHKRYTSPHSIKNGSLRCSLPLTINCINKKPRYQLTHSWEIDYQRILQSDWTRGTTNQTLSTLVVSDASFPWWLSPCKKSKISLDSFQRHWWSKNQGIWLHERQNWPHPSKSGTLRCCFPLMTISPFNKTKISINSLETLMIKESSNLIGLEAQSAPPNQK